MLSHTTRACLQEGTVDRHNSRLLIEPLNDDISTGTRVDSAPLPWPQVGSMDNSIMQAGGPGLGGGSDGKSPAPVSPFLGWMFGVGTGPVYKFSIQAKDQHDKPRDYRNLGSGGSVGFRSDYVVVQIGMSLIFW